MSRGGHPEWTRAEMAALKRLFPRAPWPEILAALPARNQSSINQKGRLMGFKRLVNCKMPWWETEDDFLRQQWPTMEKAAIYAALSRHPESAIDKRASALGLKRICDRARRRSPHALIQQLRDIRRASHIRTKDLAEIIGIHPVHIAQLERGEQMPRLERFFRWVDALGYRLELVKAE